MKINVGSKNETKVEAVREVFLLHEKFKGAEIAGVEVKVDEFGHPKTLEETTKGAMDRAKQAYQNADFSVGIEGGLMSMPFSKTGFVQIAVCAIFDGQNYHLGTSPACEWPVKVIEGILNKGLDGSQAMKDAGITTHAKIGTGTGLVYLLTDGQLTRKDYNKMAVHMALAHILHPDYYS